MTLGILMMGFDEIYSKLNAGSVLASGDRWACPSADGLDARGI